MIKILSSHDYAVAMEILDLKEKAGGMQKPNNITLHSIFLKYFVGDSDQCIALGYFEEDKLISWVTLRFIYSLKNKFVNTWNITGMFSSKFDNMFSFNRPEIGLLIKTAFEIAEHRHCWKYYYTISTSHQYLYDRLWKKNNYLPTGRYTTVIEQTVDPLDFHIKRYYADIIGTRDYNDEFVIKRRMLNPEFRIKYDSLHELELQATHKKYFDYTQFSFEYAQQLMSTKKVLNIAETLVNVNLISEEKCLDPVQLDISCDDEIVNTQ
mgnify:CR=1 FL=1